MIMIETAIDQSTGTGHVDWNWEEFPTILAVLDNAARSYADKPVYSCLGQTITYAQLHHLASAFAAYLVNETPLKPGDRIAIQLPNLLQYPVVVFGAMKAGLVVVNTNPLYTAREMEHQFNDSGARALVVLADLLPRAEKVLPNTGIEQVVVTDTFDLQRPQFQVECGIPQAISLSQALALGENQTISPVAVQPDDIAVLQYTGGTTGVSKGAMLSHRNLVAYIEMGRDFWSGTLEETGETIIVPLPVYHIYGFTVSFLSLLEQGNHAVLIPNARDLSAFVGELNRHRFSIFVGIGTLFVALCNDEGFRKLDFSCLKITLSGGMTLNTDTARLWESVTGCRIVEGYGMSETTSVAAMNPIDAIQIGTVGIPFSSTKVKTIDLQGAVLPPGEPGELCLKGPQVMTGYWGRAEETASAFTEDGYLKTGDIAIIQDDGYIKIVDRIKDMIIVSGFNVFPNEIEDVVTEHPDVVECAAIGVSDEKSGEAVKLVVVSRNPDLLECELRDYCRDKLTAYKVPKYVEFRETLPKTNVGKILRRELRA